MTFSKLLVYMSPTFAILANLKTGDNYNCVCECVYQSVVNNNLINLNILIA